MNLEDEMIGLGKPEKSFPFLIQKILTKND